MKSTDPNDPLHNPFYNKFNDPVSRRHGDAQAHEYTSWLKDQNRILPPRDHRTETINEEVSAGNGLATALVLIILVLISAGVLLKSL